MSHQPREVSAHRRVWRITANAPQGEYVDRDEAARRDRQALQADAGWQQSAFDLSMGAEVHDASDTLSDKMFDELFKR